MLPHLDRQRRLLRHSETQFHFVDRNEGNVTAERVFALARRFDVMPLHVGEALELADQTDVTPEDLRAGPSELDEEAFDWGDRSRPHPHYWTV